MYNNRQRTTISNFIFSVNKYWHMKIFTFRHETKTCESRKHCIRASLECNVKIVQKKGSVCFVLIKFKRCNVIIGTKTSNRKGFRSEIIISSRWTTEHIHSAPGSKCWFDEINWYRIKCHLDRTQPNKRAAIKFGLKFSTHINILLSNVQNATVRSKNQRRRSNAQIPCFVSFDTE